MPWPLIVGFVLAITIVTTPLWKYARYFVTLIHEVGHALFGVITGGSLVGVIVNPDSSGETLTMHREGIRGTLFSVVPTLLAGYPAPAFYGAAGVAAVIGGWVDAGWAVLAACSLVCLIFARSFFTILVSLFFLGMSVFTFTPLADMLPAFLDEAPTYGLAALSMVLLVGAGRDLVEITRLAAIGRAAESDPGFLSERTKIRPPLLWVGIIWVVALSATVAAYLLVEKLGGTFDHWLSTL